MSLGSYYLKVTYRISALDVTPASFETLTESGDAVLLFLSAYLTGQSKEPSFMKLAAILIVLFSTVMMHTKSSCVEWMKY